MDTLQEKMDSNKNFEPVSKEKGLLQIKNWFGKGKITQERYDYLVKNINNETNQ